MTTILADFRYGVMVADSSISDDDRVWLGKKVYRHKGVLYGFSGDVEESIQFMDWVRGGKPPKFTHSACLQLSEAGLFHYNASIIPHPVQCGYETIGSGGKAAICAYEALGFTDPVRAVKITCRHDSASRTPVRIYKLRA
jgi:hypothetical protein